MSEEQDIKTARLKSRLLGICEGFAAGASTDVKEQEDQIASLESQIREKDAEIERLRADKERLDWLEAIIWSPQVGNGLCILPLTNAATQTKHVRLEDIGDEDGSTFSDELAEGLTIREAIDAARTQPTGEPGKSSAE